MIVNFFTNDDREAIAVGQEQAGLITSPMNMSLLNLQSAEYLLNQKSPPERLVQGLLDVQGISYLIGEPGSYKSFLALNLALSIASGMTWCDRQVRQGPVVVLAGEGNAGYRQRLAAAVSAGGLALDIPIYVSGNGGTLAEDLLDTYIEEIGAVCQPRFIIVDTMARWFTGEENAARDAGDFIRALDRLKRTFQCHVLVVHHTGKNKQFRGSTAFVGAADTIINCQKYDGYKIKLSVSKQKDGEDGGETFLQGRIVELEGWPDEFGKTPTSLVFNSVEDEKTRKLNEYKRQIIELVRDHPGASQAQLISKIQKIADWGEKRSRDTLEGLVGSHLEKVKNGNGNAVAYLVSDEPAHSEPLPRSGPLQNSSGKVPCDGS